MKTKTKKKNKKKISKVLFSKVARVASLATTVVASEILTSEKAEASITIGETAGSPNNQSVKKTSAVAVSTAIAIGDHANASNSGSAFAIALGGNTTATGNGAISIGKDAQALASSGVAMGYNSKASGGQAVAIGGNIQTAGGAQATGDQSISIGGDTIASGSSSIAIGGDDLNQANSVAGIVFKNLTGVDLIGTTTYIKTESGGAGSIAIGVQSTSSGHLSTAFGTKTKASGAYSTALGVGASSEGEGSIALGGAASSKGKTSIAIGTKVKTVGESATSMGYGAEASSKGAVAIGLDSRAGDGNAATGTAGANGINAVAIGTGARAIAKNTISIGTGNVVSGVGSGAIGDPTTITGAGTYSLGNDNGTIAASNSGVFGNNNNIKGATSGNRVIGNNNTVEVTANNALIFGNNAGVSAANGIAIGENSASTSEGSIAFGLNSKAGNGSGATFGLAKDAIAIGTNSSARGDKAVAIGKGTQANHDSNIAIGNSAETGRDLTVSNYDIKNISIGYEAGKGMNGQFNSYLGTNAGQDSKGDGNSAFGLRAGKTVTGNTNTAIGMNSGQNVKASSNTAIGLNAGQNVTANGGGSNVAIGTNAGQNVTTTSSGGGDNIAIGTNAGRNVTSTIGHNTAVGHSAGQTVDGTNNVAFGSGSGQKVKGDNNTSIGINAGIGVKSSSNVSIGSDSGQNTDGVGNTAIGYQAGQKVTGGHNISMGYQSAKGLNGGSNTIIGFQAGQEIVGGNNIIVGTNATKKVTVDNVVSIGTNSTASTNNSVAVGSYSKATGNAAIAIGQGSNASKDNSMAIGNRSTVNAVKDVAIGSDSSTSATTGVSKATITVPGTGKSITYGTFAGSNPDAAFSVGSAGRERQIQNVAAGRVTATSTDAINGSQLFAVANELGKTWKANAGGNLSGSATSTQVMPGDEVQFVAGKNLEVEQNLATGSQKYTYSLKKDVDLGSTGSLKVGPVTINNNGIDAGNKKITNVAPGTADTDAANVSQVKAAKTTVSSDDNSITVTETTKPDGHKNYDLSVDVTKLDAANKSLSNINNDGNKVISGIARKSVDVVAGTNIKNIVKNDVQNLDGTTTTTYTINANGARVVAGDGVTVATGTPGSNNITDYTVSVKNTTLTAAPGSTTVTAGDNNSYAKAGDVATAITNAAKAAKTEVKSPDSSINVATDNTSPDGHTIYNITIDKSGKVAAGDTKLVTGDTVNTAITNAKTDLINNNPLKFGGDSGTVVTRKLGDQLDIKGGATGATTSGNIAVIADGNNTLNIQLAKNLTGLDSISTNGGNTVINDNGITTPKVTINNAPTAGTDATNKDYVDSTKTKVTSNDSSVVVNKTTSGNQDIYDLSVDVTKLDAANKSLSNINNDGNKVISDIARKSVDVVAGTNIKNIVKNDVQNLDGTTTTTYTINANGARVVAGDGVTVATGTPGSNNITDYTVSVKNTTLTAAPGSTTVTAGDNNSYAKAGDVATAITNVGKASKTTVTSNDSSVTVVSKVDSGDGHVNYDLSVDTSKVAANTNLTYKANSGTGLTTTLANGLDFKDGDNTKATVGPNGEVKYSLNPTVAGINSITTNGGNTVINDSGITTSKVTINNAPTAGTDATNKDYVDSTKTKVTSNDSSVVINKTTSGNQDIYDLSVDVTKLDAANKSLSNINNDGNKVISGIARKSVDVVAGTNIKNIVKNDVQNLDGTTTTTYTINANGARVVAGDGVTVATGTPGSNNITDYTVSVKNTTLTAAPGSTTVTAGDNNSYAKAGDVATAITNVGKASKTTVTSNDSSVTVVSKVDSGDGHVNYDLSVDTSKVAANTNLTYKANSGTGLTTTLANGLDFKDGDNTKATVGPNGEVKYSLNPTVAGINSITTNGGNTVINDNGITTPSLTLTNSTPLTSSTGGKVTVPAGTGNQAVTGQTVANAINKLGDNTINLKASNGNITTKQSLNKDGGLEFNITGSNGITTTASGDTINVTIAQSGLNTSTTGGKTTVTPVTGGNTYATAGDVATAIQNAVNNSGWNAVAGSTGTGTTSGSVSNKLITPGETVKLQAGDNLNVDQSGGTFTYSLKKDISLDSVTTGDTKVANGGIIIGTGSNQVSLTNNGLNNGGNKITNVAAGTNKNDAVNVGQLNAAKTELENGTNTTVSSRTGSNGQTIYKVNTDFTSIADAIGGNTKFDPTTGKIDTSAANIGGTGQTNISDAVKAAITTVSSNDASVTVNKVQKSDGHYNYDLSVDTNKIAANTNLTYKANSGTGLTTTLANGLDFKDGDNTKATVGPNGEVKYSLNPTVAGINSITTNGGNTVINDNGVTTPSLTLTNSTPLTSSTGGKVTVPAGTGNQAVTGQTVANAINKLGDNTINLKASNGNITTKQSLNKDGGLEFNITGSNGITTTASGDTINVTIAQSGLNTSTTGGKTTVTPVTGGNTYATAGDVATAIQNAVNNSGWNAVAGSTGTGTTSGSVSNKLITPGETVKLQAGDNLNVDQSGGTFTYSLKNDINVNSITAGNNKFDTSGLTISDAAGNKAVTTPAGTTYTNTAGNTTVINPTGVVINKSAADPSKSVSLTDNGLDNGGNKITNVAAGVNPTDAVNVSQLKNAVNNATYNGPVVYTNAAGEKIVKANNGNYYKALDVDSDGNPLPGKLPVSSSDIQHSLLNADGSTTNPSTLDNVGKGKISSSSKQAINGSQLNNLGTQLGLTVDPSGTGFSNPTFAGLKNVNGSTGAAPTTFKDAVDQTIDKVNEGIIYGADNNTAGTRQQLGSRLTVESGDFASGGVNYKGQNLETSYVSDGAGNGKIIVGITENPEFNSVKAKTFTADDGAGNTTVTNGQGTTITDTAGNKNVATAAGNTYTNAAGNTTTVNSSGVTINKSAADPSKSVSLTNSGLDNGGNRITNIAAGVAPTDAVNVSQLGNAVNNLTTAINASKSEVVGGTNTNVTSSTGSNGQIVYKVDADGTTVSGGSSFVSVTQGTKDTNNITDYKVDLAQGTKDKLNSIGTGNIAAGDNNTVTGSTVHNYIQNNPLTYTDDNGTTVTRNLGQNLNIMGRATGPLTTGNIGVVAAGPDTLELRLAENVDLGPNGRVTMGKTVVNDDGIKITGGPSVTSSGIDAGGKKVTNIAEGDISPTSNDAVTGRQVYNAISAGAADKATRAELAGVNNNLTAGIAGVAAMANLPQINDSASNRFNIAVAGGAYKNGRAMALGFSGVSDGGRFVYRASASLNNKRDVAVGLGVGYQFGKRDVMPNELDRMKSMVALIEEQKDSYSRQLKQQLEQESRKNQENSELIRQLMQEVQELKNKSNVSNRSNRS